MSSGPSSRSDPLSARRELIAQIARSGTIRVGPAGWSYADWKGTVYPEPRPKKFDELRYLARYFNTIEINSTFYRPASRKTADRWAERVADRPDFRFGLKLWNRFTHERAAPWSRDDVRQAREAIDALTEADKLGAVLVQFPWSFQRTARSRAWLDDLTTEFSDLPLVVEIRHVSWNIPEFFDTLTARHVGFVNIDQPAHASGIAPTAEVTAPTAYVRVHGRNSDNWFRREAGVNERYDYLYTAPELLPWAERVKRIAERAEDVYVITNNHFQGQAAANAAMLEAMIKGERVEAPPTLFAHYGDVLRDYTHPAAAL